VIFFNNVGYLGMCGHGTIGVVTTLAHLGRIQAGEHRIETPVGIVSATLRADRRVTVKNVPSYRYRKAVPVRVPGAGTIEGDVAWGGNWFFLTKQSPVALAFENREALCEVAAAIRGALCTSGITGRDGEEIDHVELFSPSPVPGLDARNFVLCPGSAYDRSPCGTGTSAKLACLAADGELPPGKVWRQEGILGTVFEGTYEFDNLLSSDSIIPSITGSAFVTSEANLFLYPDDPFVSGIRPERLMVSR
jgi:4-hydroxyproline epimerase